MSFERDGAVDYEFYREVQNAANARKLNAQWVGQDRIAQRAQVVRQYRPEPGFGICHGTRSGREQAWFAEALPGARVIGTEIADTATRFSNTVQWDFHDRNPEWAGVADFIYSNSWDHAFDPEKAFAAWIETLKPGGVMLLDCSLGHLPDAVSAMDPFGASADALAAALSDWFAALGTVATIAETGAHRGKPVQTLVFRCAV